MAVHGTIYLLHFEPGLHVTGNRFARHYIGWTGNGLEDRLAYHLAGRGSRLIAAVVRAGQQVTVAKTWDGTRDQERYLKNLRNAGRICPLCRESPCEPRLPAGIAEPPQ